MGIEDDSITVSVYDAGVNEIVSVPDNPNAPNNVFYVDSIAKHLLGTTYVREDSLQDVMTSELFNQRPIRWAFQTPIEVHGPFVITVQFNYQNGVNDTLILQQSQIGDALGEKRNSRRVINNQNGFADGTWLPEYMALAFNQHDYDFMIEPVVEVDSFQVVPVTIPNAYLEHNGFNIYPNPASGVVFVSGIPSDLEFISVKDMTGREVMLSFNTVWLEEAKLDVTFLPSGVYGITIAGPWGKATQRFVKH